MQLYYQQDYTTYFNNLEDVDDISEETIAIGGGGVLGYKFKQPDSKLYFEVLGGAGWGATHFVEFTADDLPDQYLLWRVEFSVGYAFQ
jgi:hypothetical protein